LGLTRRTHRLGEILFDLIAPLRQLGNGP
jgi:hypothetical protein